MTEDTQIIENCRQKMAQKLVQTFVENIEQLSVTKEQAITMIEEVMK